METVAGLFETLDQAQQAIGALRAAGFSEDQLGIVTDPETIRQRALSQVDAPDVASDATSGAAVGAAVGGLTGILATLVAVSIPGVGPALVGGALASYLIGGAGGAAVGGLIGALLTGSTDLAVNTNKADAYRDRLRQGGVILTVVAEGQLAAQAQMILDQSGALKI